MYEDAKEASDESFKLVESLGLEISKDSSGSRALYDAGWEGGKTIDELWGDVLAEVRSLIHFEQE
jgi:cargo-transport protein YPP1